MSTATMTLIRGTAKGLWAAAFVLLMCLVLWGLLQPGFLEVFLPLKMRWWLERYRIWTGPVMLIPFFVAAFYPARRLIMSPVLPGRKILVFLTLFGLLFLGVLAPLITRQQQIENQNRCRQQLRQVYLLWLKGGLPEVTPSCPCQWEASLGTYLTPLGDVIVCDPYPWHPDGRLGINRDGDIVILP